MPMISEDGSWKGRCDRAVRNPVKALRGELPIDPIPGLDG
jgi:hypothetical protein